MRTKKTKKRLQAKVKTKTKKGKSKAVKTTKELVLVNFKATKSDFREMKRLAARPKYRGNLSEMIRTEVLGEKHGKYPHNPQ